MCPLEDNLLNPKVGDFLLDKERYKEKKKMKKKIFQFLNSNDLNQNVTLNLLNRGGEKSSHKTDDERNI